MKVDEISKPVLHRVGQEMEERCFLVCRLGRAQFGQVAEVKPIGLLVSGASIHVVTHQQHNLVEEREGECIFKLTQRDGNGEIWPTSRTLPNFLLVLISRQAEMTADTI